MHNAQLNFSDKEWQRMPQGQMNERGKRSERRDSITAVP